MNLSSVFCNVAWLAVLALPVTVPPPAFGHSGGSTSSFHGKDAYLGVGFENLTDQQRKGLHLAPGLGVAIAAVDHDAPAGKAGLRNSDVIVRLNGKKAQHAEELRTTLRKMSPGQTVILNIVRDGRRLEISVVLASRKAVEQQAWSQRYTVPDPHVQPAAQSSFLGAVPSEIDKTFSTNGGLMSLIPGTTPYTGITFDVLSSQLAGYFGLMNTTGLLVKSIDPNSPGSRAGVQAGDVICKANDAPMTSRSRWNHALRENRHDAVKLQILRNKQPQTLTLTLAARKS